ncbi:activator of hsp90 [Cystoisospora suis]|uniref:Activator of hsp90 n=1 Tax=Cystoisospora suis TaxID=483139 RepID=A0A2C6KY16_9APIC|nr:activator of hsp90 [Cystoisospora suis]
MAGTGSSWNAGSWHWEEKSYTRWSREYLESNLQGLSLLPSYSSAPASSAVPGKGDGVHTAVIILPTPRVTGEASVSIRKGKMIRAIDLNIAMQFSSSLSNEAWKKKRCCRGEIALSEVSVESIQDRDYDVKAKLLDAPLPEDEEMNPKEKEEVLKLVKSEGLATLHKALEQYLVDLQDAINTAANRVQGETEVEDSQEKEKDENERKAIAQGEDKEKKGLQPEKETEQRATAQPSPPQLPNSTEKIEDQGSAWNTNSYHWEEKPMTQWCISTLEDRFKTADIELLDGSTKLKFFNVKVEGEASNTLRKGKKLVIFDLAIGADWTATARDEGGVFLADSRGRMDVTEFSSETLDDYQIAILGDGKVPPQQRIDTAAKKELPGQVKHILEKFVQDLRARG